MNPTCRSGSHPFDPAWHVALPRLGFSAAGDDYRRDGVVARNLGQWIVLESSAAWRRRGRGATSLDGPGLWKCVGSGRSRRFLFELPVAAVRAHAEDPIIEDLEDFSPESFLNWALAGVAGELPRDWRAPENALVASWMPPNALTVRAGPLVRQGELVLAPDRWALRYLILPEVPAALPLPRRRCLERLARDAQERWHMVRVGLARAAGGEALVASVDLTGAPHSEHLFLAGLDGVRHIVRWLAETADILADVTVTLRSLEVCRPKTETHERKRR
jgi:hypothetical protein